MRAAPLAALVVAGLAVTGCSSPAASPDDELTLDDVRAAGELVVGTEGTYAPFSYHEGGAGELTGYDVEIMRAVGEELGIEIRFEETQWDAIFAGLDSGRFDAIANQVSINEEREAQYLFSQPYTISPGALVVPTGSDIASLDQLDGRTSAQSLTSNWYSVAESYGARVEAVEGWAQAVELLRQGRVDATVNDLLTFLDYERQQGGDIGIEVVDETDEASRSAVLFRQGSEDLVAAVDEALDALRADGTLAEISDRYFGQDVSGGGE